LHILHAVLYSRSSSCYLSTCVSMTTATCCVHGSLQPDESAEPFSGDKVCSLGGVVSQQQADDSVCQEQPASEAEAVTLSELNGCGMSDGVSPLQQTAVLDHTEMQQTVAGTYLNCGEAKYLASSHRQVFPASSRQQRPSTRFPYSTALRAAGFGCMAQPIHPALLPLDTRRAGETWRHEVDLHMVNSLVCFIVVVWSLRLTTVD